MTQTYSRRSLTRYLYPQISKQDILPIFACAIAGALFAGAYGAVHDQITFALSAEYFIKLKFRQFDYADLGLGTYVFVSAIDSSRPGGLDFFSAGYSADDLFRTKNYRLRC